MPYLTLSAIAHLADAFPGMNLEVANAITREARVRSHFPRETLALCLSAPEGFLALVIKGLIESTAFDDRGKNFVVGTYGPGALVGLCPNDRVKYVTRGPTDAVWIPSQAFDEEYLKCSVLARAVMRQMKLRQERVEQQMVRIAFEDVEGGIRALFEDKALVDPANPVLKLTQDCIAARLGVRRETIIKIMKRMFKAGSLLRNHGPRRGYILGQAAMALSA